MCYIVNNKSGRWPAPTFTGNPRQAKGSPTIQVKNNQPLTSLVWADYFFVFLSLMIAAIINPKVNIIISAS